MEIYVRGEGEKSFQPDQIVFDIEISNVYSSYEVALIKGEESVLEFLNLMKGFGLNFEDFKTVRYQIRDEIDYSGKERKKTGVRYLRELKLKMDFDIVKMSKIIEASSKLKNAPKMSVRYGLKDTKTAERELYVDAYQNAKMQADIIASAGGLKVVKCAKSSFNNIENSFYSESRYESGCLEKRCCSSASDIMAQTYIPDDIVVEQEIYCVFIAE